MGPCKGSPLRRCGCVTGGSCVHSLFQLERHWERGTGCQHDPHTFYWSFLLILGVNVQIPSCGSIVWCCHSQPAPGAFGMVLLSAAPQNYVVHSTCTNMQIILWSGQGEVASNFLSSGSAAARGSRVVCVWGAYFTHQELLQIFKPFLPEDWGKAWPAKTLWWKRTSCSAYLAERGIILIPGTGATTANACAQFWLGWESTRVPPHWWGQHSPGPAWQGEWVAKGIAVGAMPESDTGPPHPWTSRNGWSWPGWGVSQAWGVSRASSCLQGDEAIPARLWMGSLSLLYPCSPGQKRSTVLFAARREKLKVLPLSTMSLHSLLVRCAGRAWKASTLL